MSAHLTNPLFDEVDPYPLGSMSYQDAQLHSELVDHWLGMRTHEIESTLVREDDDKSSKNQQQRWIGLPTQSLLTPYSELRKMLSLLEPVPGNRVVDLGAGYGRMGFVLARHYPAVEFVGYEIVHERVNEGARCLEDQGCAKARLLHADLSASGFELPSAEIYFIYDYGTRTAILKTLEDLKQLAKARSITVIGRGRLVRDLIEKETPWLSQIRRPAHFGNFSIYRS